MGGLVLVCIYAKPASSFALAIVRLRANESLRSDVVLQCAGSLVLIKKAEYAGATN